MQNMMTPSCDRGRKTECGGNVVRIGPRVKRQDGKPNAGIP